MVKAVVVSIVFLLIVIFCGFAIYVSLRTHLKRPRHDNFEFEVEVPYCKAPYVLLDTGCYYISKELKVSAFYHNCSTPDLRGYGIAINSAEELTVITKYIVSENFEEGSQFWTCGDKLNAEDVFEWSEVSGSINQEVKYTKWLPGEPNMSGLTNCLAVILQNDELFMKSESCRSKQYFICESDKFYKDSEENV